MLSNQSCLPILADTPLPMPVPIYAYNLGWEVLSKAKNENTSSHKPTEAVSTRDDVFYEDILPDIFL